MTDFKELRDALEAGPTDGPWAVHKSRPTSLPHIRSMTGLYVMDAAPRSGSALTRVRQIVDANYIAAANPATIRALLAELDEARRDAARYQWLRNRAPYGPTERPVVWMTRSNEGAPDTHVTWLDDDDLDAAIDAMKEQP